MSNVVEDAPLLTLTALRKAGIFVALDAVEVALEGDDRVILCRWSAQLEVELVWAGGSQVVPLQWRKLRYGPAPYFERPDGGGLCTTLYLAGDRFLNRQALGLTYTSQLVSAEERAGLRVDRIVAKLGGKGPRQGARGAVKDRLLEELRSQPDRLTPDAWAHLDRDQARRFARRRRRPPPSRPLMGTRWALLRGRTRGPKFRSRDILWLLNQPAKADAAVLSATGLAPLKVSKVQKLDVPELDLRTLLPRRGFPRGHTLIWGELGESITVFAGITGEGDGRRLKIMIHIHRGREMDVVRQEIELARGQRPGDLFMVCPVTGRRLLKAYYRQERFASAQAQNVR